MDMQFLFLFEWISVNRNIIIISSIFAVITFIIFRKMIKSKKEYYSLLSVKITNLLSRLNDRDETLKQDLEIQRKKQLEANRKLRKINIQKAQKEEERKNDLELKKQEILAANILKNKNENRKTKAKEEQKNKPISKAQKTVTVPVLKEKKEVKNINKDNTDHKLPDNIVDNNTPKINNNKISDETEIENTSFQLEVSSIEIIKPEKEEQIKVKHIGYNPINVFAQSEPLHYPYVIMPILNSVIKFPRKGRLGRKGFKEESFKEHLNKYFIDAFQIFDDRFMMVKKRNNPFEPDFTLIDEKNSLNIFLDIEIDEPYEGLNNISKRKATHFQFVDTNRNNEFASRGWIVIRFAEIQVHQSPDACCNFISDVIKSINPGFIFPKLYTTFNQVSPIKQWTKKEAEDWSIEKYREGYLEILKFGISTNNQNFEGLEETELDKKIESVVIEVPKIIIPDYTKEPHINPLFTLINSAIKLNQYVSFSYNGYLTITKPISITETHLSAYCFLKNIEECFLVEDMSNIDLKINYHIVRVAAFIEIDKTKSTIKTAITYKKHIRFKYTKAARNNWITDAVTGNLKLSIIEAEESLRTVSNVQLSINVLSKAHINSYRLDENYITGYCNKKSEQRTFKFDRIAEIEILDI